jgi:hypothetical protein
MITSYEGLLQMGRARTSYVQDVYMYIVYMYKYLYIHTYMCLNTYIRLYIYIHI